jgi:hypothetical protein
VCWVASCQSVYVVACRMPAAQRPMAVVGKLSSGCLGACQPDLEQHACCMILWCALIGEDLLVVVCFGSALTVQLAQVCVECNWDSTSSCDMISDQFQGWGLVAAAASAASATTTAEQRHQCSKCYYCWATTPGPRQCKEVDLCNAHQRYSQPRLQPGSQ